MPNLIPNRILTSSQWSKALVQAEHWSYSCISCFIHASLSMAHSSTVWLTADTHTDTSIQHSHYNEGCRYSGVVVSWHYPLSADTFMSMLLQALPRFCCSKTQVRVRMISSSEGAWTLYGHLCTSNLLWLCSHYATTSYKICLCSLFQTKMAIYSPLKTFFWYLAWYFHVYRLPKMMIETSEGLEIYGSKLVVS